MYLARSFTTLVVTVSSFEGMPVARDALPTIEIGGVEIDVGELTADELIAAVRANASELEGARLFIGLVEHHHVDVAGPAAIAVAEAADALALMEIASWLGRGGTVPAAIRRRLGLVFLGRSTGRGAPLAERAQSLKAALILAQSDPGLLRRLQAELIDLQPDDDADYLRHAAAVSGAVLAHAEDAALRQALERLVDVSEATDQVAFELGLDSLRNGLEATDGEKALASFVKARDWFARADQMIEGRPDARLYRLCLDMLVAFQSDHADRLDERVQAIRAAAFEYNRAATYPDRTPERSSWLGAAALEQLGWAKLALRLGALDDTLSRRAWLKAASAMEEELLAVYTASRSYLHRDRDGGIEAVLRPRIVGALQGELRALDVLDQWVDENAGSDMLPHAETLRAEVVKVREDLLRRRPLEAAVESSPTAAIYELIPPHGRETVSARIQARATMMLDETVSRVVDDVISSVIEDLNKNADFARYEEARILFEVVVLYATRFVVMRYNMSTASSQGSAYLFNRSQDDPPLEQHLQDDFLLFLKSSELADICTPEARDLGGGRVDILFSHRWVKTTIELKRTFDDLSAPLLVDTFGAQAMSYQGANVSLAGLMVLDLFDRGGGQPNIRDQINVHRRVLAGSAVESSIVLFRIQGRRKTPSDISRSAAGRTITARTMAGP